MSLGRCGTDEHEQLLFFAAALIFLWPLGVSTLFWSLLVATHSKRAPPESSLESSAESSLLRSAVSFLNAECASPSPPTIACPPWLA